jgi:hypothetical protein
MPPRKKPPLRTKPRRKLPPRPRACVPSLHPQSLPRPARLLLQLEFLRRLDSALSHLFPAHPSLRNPLLVQFPAKR